MIRVGLEEPVFEPSGHGIIPKRIIPRWRKGHSEILGEACLGDDTHSKSLPVAAENSLCSAEPIPGRETQVTENLEFSIILPVCHGGSFLLNALASLRALDFPPDRFEVLVVGAEDDKKSHRAVAEESVSAGYSVAYIHCDNPNRSARLNTAAAAANGRFLAFADDDCVFLPDWLQKLASLLHGNHNVGIIGGQDEIDHGRSAFDIALDCVFNSFIGTGGVRRGAGIRVGKYYPKLWNMTIPRETALSVAAINQKGVPQMFDESLLVHEDVDLARRIEKSGKKILFAPEVRIRHSRDTTFRSFVGRNFNMARTCRTLGIHRFPHTVLSVFVLATLALPMASLFYRPLWIMVLSYMGIYTITLFTATIGALRRTKDLKALAIIPPLLMSLHFARGAGYLFPWGNKIETVNS
jgi:GT2 family glycosyltransferase